MHQEVACLDWQSVPGLPLQRPQLLPPLPLQRSRLTPERKKKETFNTQHSNVPSNTINSNQTIRGTKHLIIKYTDPKDKDFHLIIKEK